MPVAQGLTRWQEQHGKLSADERLLLGSLYYVAGRNREAFDALQSVEPEMKPGSQHRWCLVAIVTTLLRQDRLTEAESMIRQLEAAYPDAAEVDEARYRLAAHYFDKRELKQAKECFDSLLDSTQSVMYRVMCNEYLHRIQHFESIEEKKRTNS
ncbi:hypothetical protein ES703_118826 [subsurface metagenome]